MSFHCVVPSCWSSLDLDIGSSILDFYGAAPEPSIRPDRRITTVLRPVRIPCLKPSEIVLTCGHQMVAWSHGRVNSRRNADWCVGGGMCRKAIATPHCTLKPQYKPLVGLAPSCGPIVWLQTSAFTLGTACAQRRDRQQHAVQHALRSECRSLSIYLTRLQLRGFKP